MDRSCRAGGNSRSAQSPAVSLVDSEQMEREGWQTEEGALLDAYDRAKDYNCRSPTEASVDIRLREEGMDQIPNGLGAMEREVTNDGMHPENRHRYATWARKCGNAWIDVADAIT